ncbi:MAG: tRNA uridine-5-carboxymethylaminomethyl(34) synthesis GTPase MnmE, partial [Acidobacteriota bacterium]
SANGAGPESRKATSVVRTSALRGEGIEDLKKQILSTAVPLRELESADQFITNLRHQQLIRDSLDALRKARAATGRKIPHEMVLIDLYNALHALDGITGQTTTEDILGLIFGRFCIGK